MKKILILLLLCTATFVSRAQIFNEYKPVGVPKFDRQPQVSESYQIVKAYQIYNGKIRKIFKLKIAITEKYIKSIAYYDSAMNSWMRCNNYAKEVDLYDPSYIRDAFSYKTTIYNMLGTIYF